MKLKESVKEEIRKAFDVYVGHGMPEEHLVRLLADHAIGLLELDEFELAKLYEDGYTHDDFVNDNT